MPTFSEVYEYYLKDARSVQLSKKKRRQISQLIKNYYDRSVYFQPLVYKTVEENGETFNVRDYPSAFGNRMLQLIITFCEKYKANCAKDKEQREKRIKEDKASEMPPPIEKKKRKRIPIKQKAPSG